MKIITKNKKAFHDYNVHDRIEAGIVLKGDEVKSLRAGKISLVGSFAVFHGTELFLLNVNIATYSHAYQAGGIDPARSRKLLLHKKELTKLLGTTSQQGVTLVPLVIYFNKRSRVKVEIGICRHKKTIGKKQALKERDIKKQTARELKDVFKYK
jgi:SsrA-binding protein